jgi:NAD+ kinase
VVRREYQTEDRLTLDVRVLQGEELLTQTFAVNEASVEKAARERMLEVVVGIDGRPLSRWGCDGVVCATPTGSTAYNFSAGGPVVWPSVEALLMVPISAHALFARPLVVAPTSVLAVEVLAGTQGAAVLWCDGRRTVDLPPGARVEVRRGERALRLVRLHQAPFTDRLVAKFDLPVQGWRGGAERRRTRREEGA